MIAIKLQSIIHDYDEMSYIYIDEDNNKILFERHGDYGFSELSLEEIMRMEIFTYNMMVSYIKKVYPDFNIEYFKFPTDYKKVKTINIKANSNGRGIEKIDHVELKDENEKVQMIFSQKIWNYRGKRILEAIKNTL